MLRRRGCRSSHEAGAEAVPTKCRRIEAELKRAGLDNRGYVARRHAPVGDPHNTAFALIALGEEPPLAYTIHHARWLVHHCLSVDSRCLRKEGGRISRTAWPNWASWPYRPPRWNGHSFRRWRMSPDLHAWVRG